MRTMIFGIIVSTQLFTSTAFGGPITSGGGFAVVCRGKDSRINSAELLDLYEAKNKFGYTLIESSGSLEGDYVASVQNTYRLQGEENDVFIDSSVRKNLDMFLERVTFLPKNQRLPHLNDLGDHLNPPKGCELEPLAIWNDEKEEIKINSEIWDSLSTLDQSALVQHEISYHFERELFEKNSEGTRAFVGTIFSSNATPAFNEFTKSLPMAISIEKDSLNSGNVNTSFTYEMSGNIMKINFFSIMNRPLVTKATSEVNLSGIQLSKIFSKEDRDFRVIALTDTRRIVKVKINTEQRSDWEVEFTFIPNKPVKIGLYQKGILIQETALNFL